MSQAIERDGTVVEALRARRLLILDNIRDNDEAGINYCKVMTCTSILVFCYFASLLAPYHAHVPVESSLSLGLLVTISVSLSQEIEANEKLQCELQHKINEAINNHGNKTYLRILSQYRLQVSKSKNHLLHLQMDKVQILVTTLSFFCKVVDYKLFKEFPFTGSLVEKNVPSP